jgi:Ca2+-binding RTX toxin-like protein
MSWSITKLFRQLNSPSRRSARRAPRHVKPRRSQLFVESLEERVTPTVSFFPQFGTETTADHGGDKLGDTSPGMPVHLIFWGSYWSTTAGSQQANSLVSFLDTTLNDTAYLDGLHQYGVSRRAFASSDHPFVFNFSDPANNFSDGDVQDIVTHAIHHQGVPEPDAFVNEPVYLVVTAPGAQFEDHSAGGYHSDFHDFTDIFSLDIDHVHYGWIGNNGTLDGLTYVLSHEIVEAMTNPNAGDGITTTHGAFWTGGGDFEISDAEAQDYAYRLNGNLVQSYWSSQDLAYIVPDGNAQKAFVNGGHLDIDGDQFGFGFNDSVTIDTNSAGGVLVNLNGEVFSFDPGAITDIHVFAGSGTNSVRINHTPAGVGVTVNANGSDTVVVGDGNLDHIQGHVTVFGNGGTGIQVFDHANAFSDTYTITSTSLTRPFFAGLTYFSASFISMLAESGNNTINITSTSVPTTVFANAGDDTVNVGTGNLGTILGAVTIDGGAGTDTVHLFDNTSPYAGPYTIFGTLVNAPGSFGHGVTYNAVELMDLSAAAGDNAITVASTAAGTRYVVQGNGGSDTLIGPNAASSWVITTLNGGSLNTVTFSSMENLVGGSGNDQFSFRNGQGVSGTINAGGGSNNLVYTPYTTPVTVNLTTGVATGVGGGVSHVQNVFGGLGNDLLIGDAGNNILAGGAGNDVISGLAGNDALFGGAGNDRLLGGDGRDLLVGGSGADTLDGGNDDDILIGGLLSFYNESRNTVAGNPVRAVITEWGSANSYATRINHLIGALPGGLNGGFTLNGTKVSNDSGAVDTLFGRAGQDWFLLSAGDVVNDLNLGGPEVETVI